MKYAGEALRATLVRCILIYIITVDFIFFFFFTQFVLIGIDGVPYIARSSSTIDIPYCGGKKLKIRCREYIEKRIIAIDKVLSVGII